MKCNAPILAMSSQPLKRAVALRHIHFEDLGGFAGVLTERGFEIRYLEVGLDDIGAFDPLEPDLLFILGGPIGVYEQEEYPFLTEEIRAIATRLDARLPTIGICLGAQLIAAACGARVYPGQGKEIGWAPVRLTEDGRKGPLRHLADVSLLHWHSDTFDLPPGATHLAATDLCAHQAFAIDHHVLAFQFHPEASAAGFERWLVGHAVEIARASPVSASSLRAGAVRWGADAVEHGKRCLSEWIAGLPA